MKYSIIHLYLYGRIKKGSDNDIITLSKMKPIIKWIVRLPHKYHNEIISELVACGFLKKITRDDYKIININKSPLCDSVGEPLW